MTDLGTRHLVHDLESVPSHGVTVVCSPAKIRGGCAGRTRAVAIL